MYVVKYGLKPRLNMFVGLLVKFSFDLHSSILVFRPLGQFCHDLLATLTEKKDARTEENLIPPISEK